MSRVMMTVVVAAAAAIAGSAQAAPRESVTFTNVPSFGLIDNASNSTQTNTFNGMDAGGSYSATHLTVSGVLSGPAGATYSREACILVTPPGGTPFVMQPYNAGAGWTGTLATAEGRYAIPPGSFATAGSWSFLFFEQFDDATAQDCQWDTVTITLDDGTLPVVPVGTNLTDTQSMTWTNVDSDGVAATPGSTRTVTFNPGPNVGVVKISGIATGRTPYAANFNAATLSQMVIRVTPPGGAAITGTVFGATPFSTDSVSVTAPLAAGLNPAGIWTVDFYESTDTPGGVDNVWNSFTLTVGNVAPPTSTTISIPGDASFGTTAMTIAAGETKWFTFTLAQPLVATAGDWLDIDTETSTIADTAIALYNATGGVVTSDTDDGSGTLSQLTYGFGIRAAVGNGQAYNGRDGATLAAGPYYVAVAAGNTGVAFVAPWSVTNTNVNTGDATLRIRKGNSSTTTPPTSVSLTIPGDGSFGATPTTLAAGETKWFTFTLSTPLNGFAGEFLDIDTETSTIADTAIALYNATGTLVVSDLDDGSGTLSQFSFGIGGGGATGNSVPYNGRDGRALPAGAYYIALTAGNTGVTFLNNFWFVLNTNTNTGNAVVRIRKGAVSLPAPPTATELGAISGPATTTVTATIATGAEIKWYKFLLTADATNAAGNWLDIDTEGTTAIGDTEIGVYALAGFLMASDDDDGTGVLSQLSFGQTTPIRPYTGTAGGNGRDGGAPAGRYYLAVGGYDITFSASGFGVTGSGTATGDIRLNFHTNLSSGPTPCNAADVAGLGGSTGPDHLLTPDDIIVYLNAFFTANVAIADIAVLGGAPGHDGMITPDDLIYFLSQFFLPCTP